jgi:tripartite-type tricarboxylate transporter receptor subunit TctC
MKSALMMLVAWLGLVSGAQADYPVRPIRVLVPVGVGTGGDRVARAVTEQLATQMRVAVVVDNREGAGGHLAYTAGAQAAPDGYTILMGTSPLAWVGRVSARPDADPVRNLVAIRKIAEMPYVLFAATAAPFSTFEGLVAYAKANPGKVNYATTGKGVLSHIFSEQLKRDFAFDAQDVPYKSAVQGLLDTASGKVDFVFFNIPPAKGLLTAGRLRALAVGSDQRLPSVPDAPTFVQLSGNAQYKFMLWFGFLAPAGTPADILERLGKEISTATAAAAVRSRIENESGIVSLGGPEELKAQIQSDGEKYGNLMKQLGITEAN